MLQLSSRARSSTEAAKATAVPARRQVVPVVILGLALLLWFQHFYPCLRPMLPVEEGTLLSAIVATLAALAAWFDWKTPFGGIIGRLGAQPYLLLITAPIVLLSFLTTSTVCLTLEGPPGARSHFLVRYDIAGDAPALQAGAPPANLACDAAKAEHGGWHKLSLETPAVAKHFLLLSYRNLTFRICETGKRYAPEERHLRPGGSLHVRVPNDFAPKEFHIVRLVPWSLILGYLPPAGDVPTGAPDYVLHVAIGTAQYTLPQLRSQPVYIGASESDLRFVVENEGSQDRLSRLRQRVALRTDDIDKAIDLLADAPPRRLPTLDLRGGESVEVFVERIPDGMHLTVPPFTIDEWPGIQTVFLEAHSP